MRRLPVTLARTKPAMNGRTSQSNGARCPRLRLGMTADSHEGGGGEKVRKCEIGVGRPGGRAPKGNFLRFRRGLG